MRKNIFIWCNLWDFSLVQISFANTEEEELMSNVAAKALGFVC